MLSANDLGILRWLGLELVPTILEIDSQAVVKLDMLSWRVEGVAEEMPGVGIISNALAEAEVFITLWKLTKASVLARLLGLSFGAGEREWLVLV